MIKVSSEVASSVVSGLKSQPALLAVVVLNIAMLVVLVFFMRDITKAVTTNRDQLIQLVSRCLGPDGGVLDKQDEEKRP